MKTYDLNLLRALDALLATASVTEAAARLHLSVPATSHTLARLREVMGDPLLVRAGRRLVPTPRAEALRAPVAELVAQAQALAEPDAARPLSAIARRFVLRLPEGMAVVYGARLAERLRQGMPRATLQLVPEAHAGSSALREQQIDLDIGQLPRRDPELRTVELMRQALLVALQPALLPAGRLTLARYLALPHIALLPRPGEPGTLERVLSARGLAREVALVLPSALGALVAASRAPYAATAPERVVRAMAPSLGLQVRPLPIALPPEPLRMAWHPRHEVDPAHRHLRETVRAVLHPAAPDAVASAPGLKALAGH